MRLLIDGYNLMYALGLLGRRLGPDGLRKVRHRFLNDLADRIEPVEAHQTTVVFDASAAPEGASREARHKGLTVVFAVDDEDADSRIEWLIAHHSAPKGLTVVSSDHRVQQAASRRRAKVVSAEQFWSDLEDRKARKDRRPPPPQEDVEERPTQVSAQEAAHWARVFGDRIEESETREALGKDVMLTDEEIARIEREVAEEP